MLDAFKYPRTPHLPWSPGASSDDVYLSSLVGFEGKEVVVTEKMDGENTSLYRDGMHARSIDGRSHPSRDWVKRWHAGVAHLVPEGWRFCGENMYARHSLEYRDLSHYFYLFSVWDENNKCLPWEETASWAKVLGCAIPDVFYRGVWDEQKIREVLVDEESEEGYVVRVAEGFVFQDFANHLAKWVRPNHVKTDQHWMNTRIVANTIGQEDHYENSC